MYACMLPANASSCGCYETCLATAHLGPTWEQTLAHEVHHPNLNCPYPPCESHCTLSSSILTCNFSKGVGDHGFVDRFEANKSLATFVTPQKIHTHTHIGGIAVSHHFKCFTFNTDITSGPGMNYHATCDPRSRSDSSRSISAKIICNASTCSKAKRPSAGGPRLH